MGGNSALLHFHLVYYVFILVHFIMCYHSLSQYLGDCLALGDIFIPHFHSGVAKAFQQVGRVQTHEEGDFVCH